jgi:hypothetical protein
VYLDEILALHQIGTESLRAEAIKVLFQLRDLDLTNKPGISELLDWVGYLQVVQTPQEHIAGLPYLGVLLKQHKDQIRALERRTAT